MDARPSPLYDVKNDRTLSYTLHRVQGAVDGGLDIPHSEKRFVGYDRDGKSLDAEMLHKFIYGGHVADYMNEMQARDAITISTHQHAPDSCQDPS